jgi:signal transduction histidine kinase
MKIRPKLVISFSVIFVSAFISSSYIAHTTIQSSLVGSGLSYEQALSILESIGMSIGVVSAIIGTAAILVVYWVSSRITMPMRQLDSQLKFQKFGHHLENIKIKRSSIDKNDEIYQVIETVNSMIDQLNKLEEKKEELLAIITHELKTPLAAIVGYAQILQKPKIIGELNSEQLKAIKIINRNVTNLKKMIVDILDSQKLDLEKMKFEKTFVDITKLIEKLESNNQKLMQEKQIQFVNSTHEKIHTITDRERIEQVFNHLILNAVDFVPKGGQIEIGAQTKDEEILFYVKDNGLGIPLDKQKGLFEKFSRLDPFITRRHGGTGLGLSICRGIIKELSGKIWLESKPGKGSEFYFTIPKKNKVDS